MRPRDADPIAGLVEPARDLDAVRDVGLGRGVRVVGAPDGRRLEALLDGGEGDLDAEAAIGDEARRGDDAEGVAIGIHGRGDRDIGAPQAEPRQHRARPEVESLIDGLDLAEREGGLATERPERDAREVHALRIGPVVIARGAAGGARLLAILPEVVGGGVERGTARPGGRFHGVVERQALGIGSPVVAPLGLCAERHGRDLVAAAGLALVVVGEGLQPRDVDGHGELAVADAERSLAVHLAVAHVVTGEKLPAIDHFPHLNVEMENRLFLSYPNSATLVLAHEIAIVGNSRRTKRFPQRAKVCSECTLPTTPPARRWASARPTMPSTSPATASTRTCGSCVPRASP
jgi:hypothetical protein